LTFTKDDPFIIEVCNHTKPRCEDEYHELVAHLNLVRKEGWHDAEWIRSVFQFIPWRLLSGSIYLPLSISLDFDFDFDLGGWSNGEAAAWISGIGDSRPSDAYQTAA